MTSYWQIVTSLSFFRFIANLEQSRSQIPDAYSLKLTLSLIVTFYLTITEKRSRTSLTQLSLSKKSIFVKKADFFQKILTSAKLGGPWY